MDQQTAFAPWLTETCRTRCTYGEKLRSPPQLLLHKASDGDIPPEQELRGHLLAIKEKVDLLAAKELRAQILAIDQKLDQLVLKVNGKFSGPSDVCFSPSRWRERTEATSPTSNLVTGRAGVVPLPTGDAPPVEGVEPEEAQFRSASATPQQHSLLRAAHNGTASCSTKRTDDAEANQAGSLPPSRTSIFSSLSQRRSSAGLPEPILLPNAPLPSPSRSPTTLGRSHLLVASGSSLYATWMGTAWRSQLTAMRISDYSSHGRRLGQFAESLHLFLEDSESSWPALWYSRFMPILVAVSVCTSLSQSLEDPFLYGTLAAVLEMFFDVVFLVEVLARLAVCPAPLMFFLGPFNIIDLLSVTALPLRIHKGFIFEQPVHVDKSLTTVILLCFLPVIRSLKLLRRWKKVHLLKQAFEDVLEALPVLLFPLMILTMFFACLIFFVEPEDNIGSVWAAFWLTIVTMTTVGYGDAIPKSSAGSVIVGILVIISVLYMAMPVGIVGQAFSAVWQDREKILLLYTVRNRLANWGYTSDDAVVLFDAFAVRRKGVITAMEFRIMVKKLKLGLSEDRTMELFRLFDVDSDGSITEKEFVKALFPDKPEAFESEEDGDGS